MAAHRPTRLRLEDTATGLWHMQRQATPRVVERCPTAAATRAAEVGVTSSKATATLRQGHHDPTLPEWGRRTKGTMPSRLHLMLAPTIQPTMTEENRETGYAHNLRDRDRAGVGGVGGGGERGTGWVAASVEVRAVPGLQKGLHRAAR